MSGAVLALALAASPNWGSLSEEARTQAIEGLAPLPLPERFLRATEGFLGTRYASSPLGEGEGQDPDPLLRWDAVDCVTVVEEAMALALTPDAAGLLATLNAIRYDGAPAYGHRNHVMEAQWLPANVRKGFLRDVTRRYGGDDTRTAVKVITEATWREKSGQRLGLEDAAQVKGRFELDLIPAEKALAALSKAPSGLLLVVARADRPWLVTRVSHVGVLVQSPKGPMLRHASRSFGRVVDEPLAAFLKRNLDFAKWTIDGLAVFEPTAPP